MTKVRTRANRASASVPINNQKPIQFKDEGVGLGTKGTVDEVDFTGTGLNATRAGNKLIVNSTAGGAGSDTTAIHDNEAGEIAAITEKTTLVDADVFLIEDSAASNAKKRVQRSNIIGFNPSRRKIYLNNTSYSVTNTTSETIINEGGAGFLIPGGTFQSGDKIHFVIYITTNGLGSGSVHVTRMRFNTLAQISGSTLIATKSAGSLATSWQGIYRSMIMKASNSERIWPTSNDSLTDIAETTAAIPLLSIDFSIDQYFLVTVDPNTVAHVLTLESVSIELER